MLSRPGRLSLELTAPAEVFVGDAARLTFRLRAGREIRARTALLRAAWSEGIEGPEAVALAPAAGRLEGTATLTARRRGVWPLGAGWLSWPSALGLLEVVPRLPPMGELKVVPDIRPVRSGIIDARVRATLHGIKENVARGAGSEFHQLREFQPGMDVRAIDWKRSARHRSLLAKEMRAERNHHVIVALDNGHLMREMLGGMPKIDHAINAGLATCWAAGLGGDLVGLFAYDARPRLFVPPEPGRMAFARLRSRTAELAYTTQETNHVLSLGSLLARTPRRSLVIVFSDFVDATGAELMVRTLGSVTRRHVVVFVALRDPWMAARAEGRPESLDAVAESVTVHAMLRERQIVMERLHRLGIRVIDAAPGAVTPRVVSAYLDLKGREAF